MQRSGGGFYKFIGIHSFLIGLFPFYLPVFLWELGYALSEISYFIALTGVGYFLSLRIFERIHRMISFKTVIASSLILELALLSGVFAGRLQLFFPVLALIYGAYNCFFWITNRILFFESINTENSGRHFGNFQITAAVILKAGVFCGGFLLDKYSRSALFLTSVLFVLLGLFLFARNNDFAQVSNSLRKVKTTGVIQLIKFKDEFRSKYIFIVDGLFLFLESYFWMISLFVIVKESYWKLGILFIGLMAIFGLMFFMIKNMIDKLPVKRIYRLSVALYAVSWILRGLISENIDRLTLFSMLVLITFFTSFFRLAFNKRFFDLAKTTSTFRYIYLKSYYSQFFIAVFFGAIGLMTSMTEGAEAALSVIYFGAGVVASCYFLYRPYVSAETGNIVQEAVDGAA